MSSAFKFIFRGFLFIILLAGLWACDMNDDDATEKRKPTVDVKFSYSIDNRTVTFTNESIVLNGSVYGYFWDFGDTATSTDPNPTHTYAVDDTYYVKFILTDNHNDQHEMIKSIIIGQSTTPIVNADFTFVSESNNIVTFTNTTTIKNGNITGYLWDFGDGDSSTKTDPIHAYTNEGTYKVKLTVTDNKGKKHEVTKDIKALETLPPAVVPDFTFVIAPDKTVTFTDATTVVNGSIASYAWDFGDGDSSTNQNPTHIYTNDGTYKAKLTVTDNASFTHTVTKDIVISQLFTNIDRSAYSKTVVFKNIGSSAITDLTINLRDELSRTF